MCVYVCVCVCARADLINSEMSGVAFSSVNQCFRQPDLKRMFETSPPITCPHAPDVLVCVDPCAGGEHSVRALRHAGLPALSPHAWAASTQCTLERACLFACMHARTPRTCSCAWTPARAASTRYVL